MEIEELRDFLIQMHCSSFLDTSDSDVRHREASGTVTVTSIGPWLWVKARISGGFLEKWYSRADSERTDHSMEYWHDWVGLTENAPEKVTQPEELENWALLSTAYKHHRHRPYDIDDDSYLGCSGRWVEDVSEDGKVTIKTASVWRGSESNWVTLECVSETDYFQL